MIRLFKFPRLIVSLLACACLGCSVGSLFTKTDPKLTDPQKAKTEPAQSTAQSAQRPQGASDEELKKLLEPPPPPQQLKSQMTAQTPAQGDTSMDMIEKDEVNRHALEFAKQIPNVKHIKTCFSKLYGGWYMLLYIQKGKKIALDQYSWSKVTKEWEIVYRLKEIPAKQLEAHVKGEVGDEKCFVLK